MFLFVNSVLNAVIKVSFELLTYMTIMSLISCKVCYFHTVGSAYHVYLCYYMLTPQFMILIFKFN